MSLEFRREVWGRETVWGIVSVSETIRWMSCPGVEGAVTEKRTGLRSEATGSPRLCQGGEEGPDTETRKE